MGFSLQWLLLLWSTGLVTLQPVGFSWTRDWTHIPWTGKWILNDWTHQGSPNWHVFNVIEMSRRVQGWSDISLSLSTWPLSLRRVAWLLSEGGLRKTRKWETKLQCSCGLGPELLKYYYHNLLDKASHRPDQIMRGREINCTSWKRSCKDKFQKKSTWRIKRNF